ncbi:hypothetical protein [Sphingomonas sp. CFBP 13706]|uniref:hypothetical protein n=1 Tax=Sphingomonas sp. CFBP 13706 TaxID=2775314 RepID=UPI0017853545|nr:hypothetical protein [Sphingomonas sp. CFBP 13706]MBD8734901.1 hypothetical protein [Sphingomonas sp. CFBP 13706]
MNHKEREAVITALNESRCIGIIKVRATERPDGSRTAPTYRIDYLDEPSVFIPRADNVIDYITDNMYDRIRRSHAEQAAKEERLAAEQAHLAALKAEEDIAAAQAKLDAATVKVELPEAFKRMADALQTAIEAIAALKGGK